MSTGTAISGTGTWLPPSIVTNDELCASFNAYVALENERRKDDIAAGRAEALKESSSAFIENASGIKQRHVIDKVGVLDPHRMYPIIPERPDDQISLQVEMALNAARPALAQAGRVGEDVDLIVLSTSNLQRFYPSLAMETQHALGARGFAWDMAVACSSATYAVQLATDAVRAGNATCALVVSPEIMTAHNEWRDRDCHFLFGDAACATVIEPVARAKPGSWEILSTKLMSRYSTNIRNNAGFLSRCDEATRDARDKLFYQQGRKVFKEVVPMTEQFIAGHLEQNGLSPAKIDRFWLHQANANMNTLITKRLLGREATLVEAPLILDRYGNTASCGSIIAFDEYRDDLPSGSIGLLCSFGAGYSIGSVIVRKR
jgi:beta-ketodecanoyl-[acyl-carrier-protein] synthase